jgi:DNA mismatch repair ATPase MutS
MKPTTIMQKLLPAPTVEKYVSPDIEAKEPGLTAKHYTALVTLKKKYSPAIILLRVEDFYLCCPQDAHEIKDITLTRLIMFEDNICYFFPYCEMESVINKLVKKGFKVGVCDELVNPTH